MILATYPVELRGPRIVLREFAEGDAPAIQRYAGDPEVARHMTWDPNTPEQTQEFLRRRLEAARRPDRDEYELAIVRLDTGELIGGAGLRIDSREHRRGDIGYVLRRDQWGQGFATEATALLLAFGFEVLGLHRIWATCDPANVASARVLEKAGMRLEGRIRHHFFVRGAWRDSLLYAILEDEWRAGRA